MKYLAVIWVCCLALAACGGGHDHHDHEGHDHAHHGHDHSHDHSAPPPTPKWEADRERQALDVLVMGRGQVSVDGEAMSLEAFDKRLAEAWQGIADDGYKEVLDIEMAMGKKADVDLLNSVMEVISGQREAEKERCAQKLFKQDYASLSKEQQKEVKYKAVVSITRK